MKLSPWARRHSLPPPVTPAAFGYGGGVELGVCASVECQAISWLGDLAGAKHTEDLNLNPPVSVLLIFASVPLPDCSQNQTAVSDTLRLLSDFYHDQGRPTDINFYCD
jgi:hypothetical protein